MVRRATMQDISRIAEIIVFGKRVAYRHIFNNDLVSFNELQVTDLFKKYHDNPLLIDDMIVYDDGIVKGVVNRLNNGESIEIDTFYVEPFFKGRKIGTKLIQYTISEAQKENKKRIFLWVIQDNMSARKFYEANGFRESGETRIIEGTTKIDMCYELTL